MKVSRRLVAIVFGLLPMLLNRGESKVSIREPQEQAHVLDKNVIRPVSRRTQLFEALESAVDDLKW